MFCSTIPSVFSLEPSRPASVLLCPFRIGWLILIASILRIAAAGHLKQENNWIIHWCFVGKSLRSATSALAWTNIELRVELSFFLSSPADRCERPTSADPQFSRVQP